MKKLVIPALLLLTLTSCKTHENTIRVVATETPHATILYAAKDALLTKGYQLKVDVIDKYALGNPAVSNGSADANYFQHIPYFNAYNASSRSSDKLANVANIHIEPIGLYAGSKQSVEALSDGDKIIISDNAPDYGRVVSFLAQLELVTTIEGFVATNDYKHPDEAILTKKVAFTFQIIDANLLVAARKNNEGALFFINGNYALSGGLKRSDVLVQEPTLNNPYVNIVAVKDANKDTPKTRALVEVLTSFAIKNFINETYDGAVIAV